MRGQTDKHRGVVWKERDRPGDRQTDRDRHGDRLARQREREGGDRKRSRTEKREFIKACAFHISFSIFFLYPPPHPTHPPLPPHPALLCQPKKMHRPLNLELHACKWIECRPCGHHVRFNNTDPRHQPNCDRVLMITPKTPRPLLRLRAIQAHGQQSAQCRSDTLPTPS